MMNVIYGNSGAPLAVIVNKKTSVLQAMEEDMPPSYQPVQDWNAWMKKYILDLIPESNSLYSFNISYTEQRYNIKLF